MSFERTFAQLVARRLKTDPGQPLVTAYDDATGERAELSVTTYANWVSKTANLLVDELDLDAGDTLLLDLPPHWLVPVFLGAAWSAGLTVTTDRDVAHDVVVCGPETLPEHASSLAADHVVACSLLPFAVRFRESLPAGVLDYGVLWPGQSDVFLATPPSPDTVAWRRGDETRTQAVLLEVAAACGHPLGLRLMTDLHPAAEAGIPAFLGPLARDGSVVLLRNVPDTLWPARQQDERATAVLRERDQPPSL